MLVNKVTKVKFTYVLHYFHHVFDIPMFINIILFSLTHLLSTFANKHLSHKKLVTQNDYTSCTPAGDCCSKYQEVGKLRV